MSLNDHIPPQTLGTLTLEDLGLDEKTETEIPKDHLNPQGVLGYQTAQAPSATVTVTETDAPEGITTMSQSEIEAMPTWDTKIRLVKEHADKIVDMKAIQQDIEGSGKIGRHHTDNIHATFESFYSDSNKAVMYTTFESLTNYNFAKTFMERKIKSSMEALVTEYEQINTDVASEMMQDIAKARDFCIYELRDIINETASRVRICAPILCSGSLLLPFKDGQFLNMTCEDFTKLDISNVSPNVPLSQEFIDNYLKMVAIWKKNSKLRNFFTNSMAQHVIDHPGTQVPSTFDGLYLATIITGFGGHVGDVMGKDFVYDADARAENIEKARSDLNHAIQKGGEDYATALSTRGADLVRLAQEAASMQGTAVDLGEFAKACAFVVSGLAALR